LKVKFEADDGSLGFESTVHKFDEEGGVFLAMYNTDESIREFAHTCFKYGLEHNIPVYLGTKQQLL